MAPVEELGTILGVWAHPDDEAYLMGGVMASASDTGQRVACVTATRGEAGETADPLRWPPDRLAAIREAELACALGILGVTDHEWLDYPDGGLAGVDPPDAVARIGAAIRRVRPDTVMTFGPDGMTGHPDHRAVSAWTAFAVHEHAPRGTRLLFATKTHDWVEEHPELNRLVFPDAPPPRARRDDLVLDLRLADDLLERKVSALEAQASQTSGLIAAVGRERFGAWVRDEHFTRAAPAGAEPARR
ncbi:MAG: PIG-L family deacetylase [Acidimicrobiia bacterium]|nr:PIG-L family deacetylase [Acidimicrobiia bacterium]